MNLKSAISNTEATSWDSLVANSTLRITSSNSRVTSSNQGVASLNPRVQESFY